MFLFLGKNSIPLIAQSAYEKFTTKVKNRRTSTFFMGFAYGFEAITVAGLVKVAIFSIMPNTELRLKNKEIRGALNLHFCQTRFIGCSSFVNTV
jgi:hypothetical protein